MSHYTIFASLFFLLNYFSPISPVEIQKGEFERKGELRHGIRLLLNDDVEDIKRSFKKFVRKEYGLKLEGYGFLEDADEMFANKVIVEDISEKQLDFYAQIIESPTNEQITQLTLFASLGYDIYINPNDYADGYKSMENMLEAFAIQYVPEMYKNRIKAMEGDMKYLEKTRRDLAKTKTKKEKSIKKLRLEINNLEEELKQYQLQFIKAERALKSQIEQSKLAEQTLRNFKLQ